MVEVALLSFENAVFKTFAFYAGVLLLKTLAMSLLTARYRLPRKVFPSPEDYGRKQPTTLTTDPDVERVRRCHLNDLENILPFVLIGFFYVMSNPDVATAILHFRLFAGARIMHTIVYIFAVPQPSRALSFMVGMGTVISMGISVVKASSFAY